MPHADATINQRPGMKRCIGSQEITIFFIGPSYGELYCESFGVLQSKFRQLSQKLFMDYSLINN